MSTQSPFTPEVLQEVETFKAEQVLRFAHERYGDRVAFASSFGAEDVVVIDLISRHAPWIRVFTLDTGRLPQETYELAIDLTQPPPTPWGAGACETDAARLARPVAPGGRRASPATRSGGG